MTFEEAKIFWAEGKIIRRKLWLLKKWKIYFHNPKHLFETQIVPKQLIPYSPCMIEHEDEIADDWEVVCHDI